MYAELAFPLPFDRLFTYRVPVHLEETAEAGRRAAAPFGKRVLTGYIVNLLDKPADNIPGEIKELREIIDDLPIIDTPAFKFYKFIAEHYLSSLGDALRLADPYGTDVRSWKRVYSDMELCAQLYEDEKEKDHTRAILLKILSEKESHTVDALRKQLGKRNIQHFLKGLELKGAISMMNEVRRQRVQEKTLKFVRFLKSRAEVYAMIPELERSAPAQLSILMKMLGVKQKELPLADVLREAEASHSSATGLEKKGIIEIFDKHIERIYSEQYSETKTSFKLTSDQEKVIGEVSPAIEKGEFKPFLLHGVTGSGKTQVYIELVKKTLSLGKTGLILVPEISLTPQMTARLNNEFGGEVTVLHSRMSIGERYDSWQNILRGNSSVVTGARSALFAPLKNIGLIVVDEEHDNSYKQTDRPPNYQARDAAVFRASLYKCPVLLGSATPSVESMYNAVSGKYQLLNLPDRIDDAKLPEITLVNTIEASQKKEMEGSFSHALLHRLKDRMEKKEGSIILQNRRGFATRLFCVACGHVFECEDCSVPMVYHINANLMKCHYCAETTDLPEVCPTCGSRSLKYFGTGTEKIEDELEYYFPNAATERIDSDSISQKGKLGSILNEFKAGEVDILVGTQMVSKGLDFSRVTLVGVISAESNLWMPDFRADERTFQLLTQVAGRAGRSATPGEVVIQTQNHEHFVLQKVLEGDYQGFYEKEIKDREIRGFPPFTHLCLVEVRHEDPVKARGAITDFFNEAARYRKWVNVTPPSAAVISKLRGEYRFQIIIRSAKKDDPGGSTLRTAIRESHEAYLKNSKHKSIRLFFDVNPYSIL